MCTRPRGGIVALGLLSLSLSGCLYLGYDSCDCTGHKPGWKLGPVVMNTASPTTGEPGAKPAEAGAD